MEEKISSALHKRPSLLTSIAKHIHIIICIGIYAVDTGKFLVDTTHIMSCAVYARKMRLTIIVLQCFKAK